MKKQEKPKFYYLENNRKVAFKQGFGTIKVGQGGEFHKLKEKFEVALVPAKIYITDRNLATQMKQESGDKKIADIIHKALVDYKKYQLNK